MVRNEKWWGGEGGLWSRFKEEKMFLESDVFEVFEKEGETGIWVSGRGKSESGEFGRWV